MILYIVSYVVFIVTYFAIACCERVRKRSPGNIIAITIFTLSLSLLVSTICLFHDVTWVLMAMGITAALCLGLTLFSFQTKIDFTGILVRFPIHLKNFPIKTSWTHEHTKVLMSCILFLGLGPYLFIACWCLFIFGIMAVIFASTGNRVLYTGKCWHYLSYVFSSGSCLITNCHHYFLQFTAPWWPCYFRCFWFMTHKE